MLTTSWSTFRDRWPIFVGAVITVAVGVALVQASLLALIAAVTEPISADVSAADQADVRDGLGVAVMTLGMTVGISVFVAFFVVGSTFSFTVAERHRDFGLLRLAGASPGQIGRLLLGEALLLGSVGTTLGVLLGFPVLRGEIWMLTQMDFLPDGFTVGWRPWIIAVSLGTGTGIAVIASVAAARSAAAVPPLEAVRDTEAPEGAMSRARWSIGILALVGATALFAATARNESDPLETSLPGLMVMIIALAALSPLLVPLVATAMFTLLAPLLRGSPISDLSHANVAAGVRRSASTAAPVIVLVGLVVGFVGTVRVVNAGFQEEGLRTTTGDVIIASAEPLALNLESIQGVRTVSEEVRLEVSVDAAGTSKHYEGEAVAIDPTAYQQTRNQAFLSGDLGLLHGETVALQRNFAAGLGARIGDMVMVGIDGSNRELRVVATFPYTLSGPRVLLPLEVLSDRQYDRQYIVQTDPGTQRDEIINLIRESLALSGESSNASVVSLQEWISKQNSTAESVVAKFTLAVLGLVSVYIFIAIVNAVVISTGARRREFGIARLTGLTRCQVIRMTLLEALIVVIVGIALGVAAATGAITGATVAVSAIVGARVVVVPWEPAMVISFGSAATVGLATTVSTFAATRQLPAVVAGSRE
jgi:putative ABC transport system permease protein